VWCPVLDLLQGEEGVPTPVLGLREPLLHSDRDEWKSVGVSGGRAGSDEGDDSGSRREDGYLATRVFSGIRKLLIVSDKPKEDQVGSGG
jgi:hypothetical protein